MRRGRKCGVFVLIATFLFVGCSGTVETGPVPTITPRATVTPAPTSTPMPTVAVTEDKKDDVVDNGVYGTKNFKEYYEKENKLPQLKIAYADLFTVGLDTLVIDVMDEKRQNIIKEQFNTLSVKADLSPENIMDYETSKVTTDLTRIALNFSGADMILKFAQENNIPVRGPKLITYEVPEWAFTKDLNRAQVITVVGEDGKETTTVEFASAEVMLARMENYIKDVITYCNTNYPGLVISWDVLDDPINAAEQNDTKYRSNYWYQTIGEDYIVKACEIARKYATAEQKLFLSQDALHEDNTRKPSLVLINLLKEQELIDGVCIQAHYTVNSPNVFDMENAFKSVSETGLEIQITEFYVDSNEGAVADQNKTPEELLARGVKRYKAVMTNFVNMEQKKSYNITGITFEGLTNDTSSLNEPKDYVDASTGEVVFGVASESYPYFFDKDLNVMDTFFATLGDVTIKGY